MKNLWKIPSIIIVVFCIFSSLGQAFTSEMLLIEVQNNGNAYITFEYSLNVLEKAAVYLKIADPKKELKNALENMFHHPVSIDEVTPRSTRFLVQDFADIIRKNETIMVKTPAISFEMAERALNKYWFAPLVQADYSADVARILYPDGYEEEYFDTMRIPANTHTLSVEI